MSYKTLEQRFLEKSSKIYNQYNNETALIPEIKPDTKESRSRIKDDSRSLPVVSGLRDAKLFKSFLASSKGELFIGKQLLLQTGNTFAETRFFNLVSFAANVVPYLRAVRFRGSPFYNLTTPTRENRGALQAETNTSFTAGNPNILTRFANRVRGTASTLLNTFGPLPTPRTTDYYGSGYTFYERPEDNKYKLQIGGSGATTARGFTKSTWVTSRLVSMGDKKTRGEPSRVTEYNDAQQTQNIRKIESSIRYAAEFSNRLGYLTRTNNRFYKKNEKSSIVSVYTGYTLGASNNPTAENSRNELSKINYTSSSINTDYEVDEKSFYDHLKSFTQVTTNPENRKPYSRLAEISGNTNPYFTANPILLQTTKRNGESEPILSDASTHTKSNPSGLKDPYNILPNTTTRYHSTVPYNSISGERPAPSTTSEGAQNLPARSTTEYDVLNYAKVLAPRQDTKDIIKFRFKTNTSNSSTTSATGPSEAVFRAFISSIRESVKPEFNEQRYIGRTERYVNYAGVKRTVSLEFNIVAFSKDEIDVMWMRVNYLTGLAFPQGASLSGFMVPPLFKMTIGNIYADQPCYIDSLDYDFLDDKITFDIDKEVSQVINVKMNVTLLEKTTRFYDTPFYQITENALNASKAKTNSTSQGIAQA
jgi:hypothetical protein